MIQPCEREFLQQATKIESLDFNLSNFYVSEILDGVRMLWDGGVSIGLPKSKIPWANCADESRYTKLQICTGFWTHDGNIIHTPKWFSDNLPPYPLDGMAWIGYGEQQLVNDIITKSRNSKLDTDWRQIKFMVFDAPAWENLFSNSTIAMPSFQKVLKHCLGWIFLQLQSMGYQDWPGPHPRLTYEESLGFVNLLGIKYKNPNVFVHKKHKISNNARLIEDQFDSLVMCALFAGSKGVILRKPDAVYAPIKSPSVLEYKPN